ncbi:MAG: glycerophosphodiester phosphodiesterase, partial [Deltaproteobacteria bacterium]
GEGYEAERVPTLEDALRLPNVRLMIEMKTVARPEMLARVVLEVVHKARAENRVILASFDAAVLAAAHKADPTMPLMGLAETADELRTMLTLPIDAVGVKTTLASEALDTAPKHMPVWVWTIYTSAGADEMIRLGVQGLITDVPKRLVRHVGQAASL